MYGTCPTIEMIFILVFRALQVMDDRWESEISEYGAINITGFRIVDTNRRYVKDFLDGWKRLDPTTSIGAGKESISVSVNLSQMPHHIHQFETYFHRHQWAKQTDYISLKKTCNFSFLCTQTHRHKPHWCTMPYLFWLKHSINYCAKNPINFVVTRCDAWDKCHRHQSPI